jgi:hypothetical protein
MSGELHDNLHSNCLQQPCKMTQPIERSHFFRSAVLFCKVAFDIDDFGW